MSAADKFTYVDGDGAADRWHYSQHGQRFDGRRDPDCCADATHAAIQPERADRSDHLVRDYDHLHQCGQRDDIRRMPRSAISAVNDTPDLNQVVVRFSQTLLSGNYTVRYRKQLKGQLNNPTTGNLGADLPSTAARLMPLNFTLDLGSIVNAVVPQPVTANATTGQLQQAVNEVDVYFTDQLSAASAQNPQFYQLIATDNTANTADQTITTPTSVVTTTTRRPIRMAQLFFFQSGAYYADPNNLSATDRAHDLNSLAPNGTQAMRLRIGDSYTQPITTTALSPAAGAAGTTYADAYPVLPSRRRPVLHHHGPELRDLQRDRDDGLRLAVARQRHRHRQSTDARQVRSKASKAAS